jgi:hypothetical protein
MISKLVRTGRIRAVDENSYTFEAHFVRLDRIDEGKASHGETLASTSEEKFAVSGEPKGSNVAVNGSKETWTEPCLVDIE